MAVSKSISIRVPQEMLEQLDAVAAQKYPARKEGSVPNRSQMILDCIQKGLEYLSTAPDTYPAQRQTKLTGTTNLTVPYSAVTLSGSEIKHLIQMLLEMQQQMQQLLAQALLPAINKNAQNHQQSDKAGAVSSTKEEIASLRQEVAEVKKF